jgi:uncharacterized protein YoxC
MDFETVSSFFKMILPILGCLVLVVLIILIIRLVLIIKRLHATIDKVDTTLSTTDATIGQAKETLTKVNGYIDELKPTVNTVVNMSTSVEAVRATTEGLVKKSISSFEKGYGSAKKVFGKYFKKNKADTAAPIERE